MDVLYGGYDNIIPFKTLSYAINDIYCKNFSKMSIYLLTIDEYLLEADNKLTNLNVSIKGMYKDSDSSIIKTSYNSSISSVINIEYGMIEFTDVTIYHITWRESINFIRLKTLISSLDLKNIVFILEETHSNSDVIVVDRGLVNFLNVSILNSKIMNYLIISSFQYNSVVNITINNLKITNESLVRSDEHCPSLMKILGNTDNGAHDISVKNSLIENIRYEDNSNSNINENVGIHYLLYSNDSENSMFLFSNITIDNYVGRSDGMIYLNSSFSYILIENSIFSNVICDDLISCGSVWIFNYFYFLYFFCSCFFFFFFIYI
jgi:hypothetical protein